VVAAEADACVAWQKSPFPLAFHLTGGKQQGPGLEQVLAPVQEQATIEPWHSGRQNFSLWAWHEFVVSAAAVAEEEKEREQRQGQALLGAQAHQLLAVQTSLVPLETKKRNIRI